MARVEVEGGVQAGKKKKPTNKRPEEPIDGAADGTLLALFLLAFSSLATGRIVMSLSTLGEVESKDQKGTESAAISLPCCRRRARSLSLIASNSIAFSSFSNQASLFFVFLTLPGSTLSNALTTLSTREVTASLSR